MKTLSDEIRYHRIHECKVKEAVKRLKDLIDPDDAPISLLRDRIDEIFGEKLT